MTLVIRSLFVAMFGVAIFFGYVQWGEPALRAMQSQ